MSYLARLALRALGRPVHARLLPRVDTPPRFAANAEWSEGAGGQHRSAPPEALHDMRQAPPARAAAVTRSPAGTAEAAAEPPRSASIAQPPADDGRAPESRASARNDIAMDAPARDRSVDRSGATPPTDAPANLAGSAAPAPAGPRARSDAHAEPGACSTPTEQSVSRPTAPRDGARRARENAASEAPERNAGDSAAPALAATLAGHRVPAMHRRAPSPRQAEMLREAPADAEPAAVNVEIGRIEVRIAPPPVPAPRPRAAPEGFDRYWRLRNYLDRSR